MLSKFRRMVIAPGNPKPVIARLRRAAPILVCKKCPQRCTAAPGIKRALKAELKRRPAGGRKPPRMVTTNCFGICPKRAVALASGQSLHNGQYVLVEDRQQICDALDLLTVPASTA